MLTFTLKPLSKQIDGDEAKPITVEKVYSISTYFDGLHDLPPANYEASGTATLPDGSTKRILLSVPGANSGTFSPSVQSILQPYSNTGEIVVPQFYWVLE